MIKRKENKTEVDATQQITSTNQRGQKERTSCELESESESLEQTSLSPSASMRARRMSRAKCLWNISDRTSAKRDTSNTRSFLSDLL